jgi:hypothetical protein
MASDAEVYQGIAYPAGTAKLWALPAIVAHI